MGRLLSGLACNRNILCLHCIIYRAALHQGGGVGGWLITTMIYWHFENNVLTSV